MITSWNRSATQNQKRILWNESKSLNLDDAITTIAAHFPIAQIIISDGENLRSLDKFFPFSPAKNAK